MIFDIIWQKVCPLSVVLPTYRFGSPQTLVSTETQVQLGGWEGLSCSLCCCCRCFMLQFPPAEVAQPSVKSLSWAELSWLRRISKRWGWRTRSKVHKEEKDMRNVRVRDGKGRQRTVYHRKLSGQHPLRCLSPHCGLSSDGDGQGKEPKESPKTSLLVITIQYFVCSALKSQARVLLYMRSRQRWRNQGRFASDLMTNLSATTHLT